MNIYNLSIYSPCCKSMMSDVKIAKPWSASSRHRHPVLQLYSLAAVIQLHSATRGRGNQG